MTFYDDEIRSPVQVGDLAAALLELAALDLSGPLNVAGADDVSRAELAELVAGHPVRSAPAPSGRPLDCSLDSSRARSLLRTELRGVRSCVRMNRLGAETSPYLLQHAENPVDWYPWGAEALERARRRTGRSCSRSATAPATGAM